jgi:hypothetical protein
VEGNAALNGVPVSQLIEARERTDAGVRLAMPQLAEQIGLGAPHPKETPPAIEPEAVDQSGAALGRGREAVMAAALPLPLEHEDIHLRINAVVNEIDRIGAILAERKK